MGWAIAVCFVIGAVCALRLPVLIFALIVAVVIAAYFFIGISAGWQVAHTLAWSAVIGVALEAGYLSTHGAFYILYVRSAKRDRAHRQIQSKYKSE